MAAEPLPGGGAAPRSEVARRTVGSLPRLALSPEEAAATLGVSRDYFDTHIAPELRIVRRGRRKLVPVRELDAWLEREANYTLRSAAHG